MKRILNRSLIILGVLVLGSAVFAAPSFYTTGNPLDTPSGTDITAEAANSTVGYSDTDASLMPTVEVEGGDINTAVTDENGFSMLQVVVDQTVTAGDVVTHETYSATNEGNANDTYSVKSLYFEQGGALKWTIELVSAETDTVVATLTPATPNTYSRLILDNDDLDVYYVVKVSDEVTGAPDGSSVQVITTFEAAGTPVGEYTGGNDYTYGGTSEADDIFTDSVSAPLMTLTRESVVDSPSLSTYTGGVNDPVPGAVITYTMYYENLGSATAESVIIIDKVSTIEGAAFSNQTGSKLGHVNAAAGARGVINLTHGGQGSASGWTAYYTTAVSPDTSYDGSGWVSIGSVDSANYPSGRFYNSKTDSDLQYDAVWIKWQKANVDPGERESLVWGVSIR